MIERYSHKNMAFILIEVQTKRGFYALCFPYLSLDSRSLFCWLLISVRGHTPALLGFASTTKTPAAFTKKRLPPPLYLGRRRMLLCFLSLICVVERKERKEVAKNLCFD